MKIHHVGHITKSLHKSITLFESLGFEVERGPITDKGLGVKLIFLTNMFGERIELVEPLPDQVDILKILGARPGAYHFAFEVEGSAEDLSSLATSRKLLPTMVERPAQAFPRSTVSFYIAMDGSLLEFIRREP